MDNDDTGDEPFSLVGAIGAYAELYPDIGARLREIARSDNPEIRKRMKALSAASKARETRRREHLGKVWGLTPTEVRLAVHLSEGGSLAGYCEVFKVSLGTARSQLKSVFAKTGVNRQAALAALIPRA